MEKPSIVVPNRGCLHFLNILVFIIVGGDMQLLAKKQNKQPILNIVLIVRIFI